MIVAEDHTRPDIPAKGRALIEMKWRPVAERPEFDHQPCRQFIRVEGSRYHSGVRWARVYCGIANIRPMDSPDGHLGYKAEDMLRIFEEGDMDAHSAEVTHWMPATFPPVRS